MGLEAFLVSEFGFRTFFAVDSLFFWRYLILVDFLCLKYGRERQDCSLLFS